MAKVIYKGLKEDGLIDAELKRTPVLITELIEKVTKEKTSKMDIVHELEEIRKSAEQDQRIAQTYSHVLRVKKNEIVHCRDCANYDPEGHCFLQGAGEDDYCSYGQWKTVSAEG